MSDEKRSAQLASLQISRTDDAAVSGLRGTWPWLALSAAIGGVAVGLVMWLALPRHSSAPTGASAITLATTATSGAPQPLGPASAGRLVASGYVVARRRATVAAEITGRVADVLVEEGMVVEKGQLLARLDDTLAATDLRTAQSRIVSANADAAAEAAQLADARRIQKRTDELAKNHLASEADLTRVQTQVTSLEAALTRAQAEAKTATSDAQHASELLAKHRIVAPFAGVVVDKNAQPGEIISPMSSGGFTRTGICTIVDMDSLEIEVDVNEAYISRVRPNQEVQAVLDAYPDWTIPARVIAIVPTANRDKATVRVRIALLSKDLRILPDMAIKVSFSEQ